MDKIAALRESGHITRLHTVPHLQKYTVAQHTWTMLVLLHQLFPSPGPSKRLMWAITFHDVAERWTGDIPATTKWFSPELVDALTKMEKKVDTFFGFKVKLNSNEKDWLKALDLLELFLYCEDELAMGNKHVQQVRDNCYKILAKHSQVPKEVQCYILKFQWKREDNIWRKD